MPAMPPGRVPRKHELIRSAAGENPPETGLSGAIEARTVSGMYFQVDPAKHSLLGNTKNPARKEKFVIRPAIRDQKRAFSLPYWQLYDL